MKNRLKRFLKNVPNLKGRSKIEKRFDEFSIITDYLPYLVWTAKPNGDIDYCNKSFIDAAGNFLDQESFSVVLHPEDRINYIRNWQQSLQTGTNLKSEVRIKSKNGNYRTYLASVAAIKENGKLVRWVGTYVDIQEQKDSEQAHIQTKEQLLKINEELDRFVFTAGHDLISPINNIEGLVNMLENNLPANSVKENIYIFEMFNKAIKKFKVVIDELTDAAKNKDKLFDKEDINIQELIDDITSNMISSIQSTHTTFHLDLKLPVIKFSKKNLRSILYNLINNSIKYKSDNYPEIIIATKETLDWNIISVSDNGLGFDAKDSNKIFNKFNRLHNHVSGSGIGLYMLKRIVEGSGGKIRVSSKLGEGTTFKIFLKKG